MIDTTERRIYVACLASYNNGRLFGKWIDAEQDAEDIHAEVAAMLAASPEPGAEEWAIHDYEGFHGLRLGESESFERVAELAALLSEHGPAYAAYVEWVGEDYATPAGFEEAYLGNWDSEQAYAENFLEDIGAIPDDNSLISRYFDYAAFTRDLFMGDCVSIDATGADTGVYVFDRNA